MHTQFRLDVLHQRSRELANQIDRARLLADEPTREVPPGHTPRRALSIFSLPFADARTTTR